METMIYGLVLIAVISLIFLVLLFLKKNNNAQLEHLLQENLLNFKQLEKSLERLENNSKDEFQRNRTEFLNEASKNREELNKSLDRFSDQFKKNVDGLNEVVKSKYDEMNNLNVKSQESILTSQTKLKEELGNSIKNFENKLNESIKDLNESIRVKFSDFSNQQKELNENAIKSTKEVKTTVEEQLKNIRIDNNTQLEEMRKTVDEKLQKTLNERLNHSFETVGKQLIAVQEGLGEMKTLANDVGGLKKVLGNVKMRGGIGEIQLSMLLEQLLAPDQYDANVKTKAGSSEVVEFAIKLPGKGENGTHVYLPIDAKFPKDIYEQLQDAYEEGEVPKVQAAQKNLETTIKKMAKDIYEKYIDPPATTDFGIMFLPFEGIYAEVVRKASLLEELQRDYKIIVTGPSTLAAILNSLQMGFKTLAIQKRSSEVWQVLGAVKKEFGNFSNLMEKAQKNLQTGINQLDEVMGKRTRAIQRKLSNVEALDESTTQQIFPELNEDAPEDFEE
jgi:DNA recombination protein RmuC